MSHPDLEALRRTETTAPVRVRRPWLPRVTITVLVLGGLAAAYAVLQPVLFPPRHVTLLSVRPTTSAPGTRASSVVQAAGWVEADPFPITVRPLVSGVVDRLEVVEGTKLVKDETVIAVLRNLALENELELARAALALRKSEHALEQTHLDVANSLLEQKLELRTAIAKRHGELAIARAEVDRARARRKAAEAALERAEVDLQAQQDLSEAGRATPVALLSAKAAVKEAEAQVTEVRFQEVRFVAELTRITDLLDLAREALRDPRDLQGDVDNAERVLARAAAAVADAEATLAVATRNVEHLTIRAPVSGIVLRLEAAPGAMAGPDGEFRGAREGTGSTGGLNRMSGGLCLVYDPAKLQARVDLPYGDLPGIETGTEVEIESKAIPKRRFKGVVDRLVREADITQAKLQVKVRFVESHPLLRPEMICSARFLVKAKTAGAAAGAGKPKPGPGRFLVPSGAVRGDALFVFDPRAGGSARRIAVRVLSQDGEWTEVEGPLGLSSKVILEEVEDGEKVKGKQ